MKQMKHESIKKIGKDIEKLESQIEAEQKYIDNVRKKAASIKKQHELKKELFATKKNLENELKSLKFSETRRGKMMDKAKGMEKSAVAYLQKPETKKQIKKLGKWLFG